MRVVSIVGARPEFVQLACLSRAIRELHEEIIVHTGQHHDSAMFLQIYEQLDIPKPDFDLSVARATPSAQIGEMMIKLEERLLELRPDAVIVRGDTNSTLAGALSAAKIGIPVIHVEAGERSFAPMSEETNRLLVDRVSRLHLCVGSKAVMHLQREGLGRNAHVVGDPLLDAFNRYFPKAKDSSSIFSKYGLEEGRYVLATLHRAENVDDPVRFRRICSILNACDEPVVLPLHPRAEKNRKRFEISFASNVKAIPPVAYLEMLKLEAGARLIVTDSGGVQREAYFNGVPCLTVRAETEWTETIESGWNKLVDTDEEKALSLWHFTAPSTRPPLFGDGNAAERIAALLERAL